MKKLKYDSNYETVRNQCIELNLDIKSYDKKYIKLIIPNNKFTIDFLYPPCDIDCVEENNSFIDYINSLIIDKWDVRYLKLAMHVAKWSKDNSTQVGAVISKGKKLRSLGFNGMPSGIKDDIIERNQRPNKYFWYSHAEANALFNYPKKNIKGCTMYVTHFPCATCARSIVESGITRIVTILRNSSDFDERWKTEHSAALEMFREVGIIIDEYDEKLIKQYED